MYGVAFPDKKLMAEWKKRVEEAEKRNHRRIGQVQELFFMDPVTPGCVFMLPHGTRIYNRLQDFIRAEYRKRGFDEVVSPNIFNVNLWKTSGHWDHYKVRLPLSRSVFSLSTVFPTHVLSLSLSPLLPSPFSLSAFSPSLLCISLSVFVISLRTPSVSVSLLPLPPYLFSSSCISRSVIEISLTLTPPAPHAQRPPTGFCVVSFSLSGWRRLTRV